jgi:hypothetical protein
MKKIVFTIEEDSDGDLNATLELANIEMLEALDIIQEAKEEIYLEQIRLN